MHSPRQLCVEGDRNSIPCRLGLGHGGSFALTSDATAARNALKRKKQHEQSLEQTNGQITMLEQQIYSIESANINHETIIAMKNASDALKQIHGNLTMDKVDQTMFVTAWVHFR